MNNFVQSLPITPARLFTGVGLVLDMAIPGAGGDTRVIVGSAVVGAYVIGATIVEAVKHKHGTAAQNVENAVRSAVYAIRQEDSTHASR